MLTRRSLLKSAGGIGVLALVAPGRVEALIAEVAQGGAGRFLTAGELDTLRAVTARLIPGPPEDPDPGALEARCAEAIDLLLGAFAVDPPLIHAGGPFSNRAGAQHDDFAALPGPAQDLLLQDQSDSDLQDFLGVAFEHCIEFMYGPPEYGGNKGLAGWLYTNWPGDRQPRGFTRREVSEPG